MQRDGLGIDGGRVLKLELVYEKGSSSMTGNQLMSKYGLRSSWFNLTPEMSGKPVTGAVEAPTDGVGDALTGDAGGPVAAGTVVREVGAEAVVASETTTNATTNSTVNAKAKAGASTKTPASKTTTPKLNKSTTTLAIAVAVGADPVRVVVGSDTPVGSPTTKVATKKSSTKKK